MKTNKPLRKRNPQRKGAILVLDKSAQTAARHELYDFDQCLGEERRIHPNELVTLKENGNIAILTIQDFETVGEPVKEPNYLTPTQACLRFSLYSLALSGIVAIVSFIARNL